MSKFLRGDTFNKIVSLLSVVSKIIAVGIAIVILRALGYIPLLLGATLGAMVLGIVTRQVFTHMYHYVKYVVIVLELVGSAFIVGLSVFLKAFIAPLPLILIFPLIGNFIGEYMRKHKNKEVTAKNVVLKSLYKLLFSAEMFGIERAAKVVVGVYVIVTLGLASVWIEVLVMASFAVIAMNEVDIRHSIKQVKYHTYHFVKKCYEHCYTWNIEEVAIEEVRP
jgi:hypothetical protein